MPREHTRAQRLITRGTDELELGLLANSRVHMISRCLALKTNLGPSDGTASAISTSRSGILNVAALLGSVSAVARLGEDRTMDGLCLRRVSCLHVRCLSPLGRRKLTHEQVGGLLLSECAWAHNCDPLILIVRHVILGLFNLLRVIAFNVDGLLVS